MDDLPLPGLTTEDPETLLPDEARRRIRRVRLESERLGWEALSLIDNKGMDRDGQEGASILTTANLSVARNVLAAYSSEFCRISPSLSIYQKFMSWEIEGAAYSLELHGSQKKLLETEFSYPPEEVAPPSLDPLAQLLKVASSRYLDETREMRADRDTAYARHSVPSCIGRANRRIEIFASHEKNVVRMKVEIYNGVAKEFLAAEMISPLRLFVLRSEINRVRLL